MLIDSSCSHLKREVRSVYCVSILLTLKGCYTHMLIKLNITLEWIEVNSKFVVYIFI